MVCYLFFTRNLKKMLPKTKQKIKEYILKCLQVLLDVGVVALFMWLTFSGYGWYLLAGILVYSIYAVWKGWSQVQLLMTMIDGLVYKYKLSRKVKHDKDKRNKRHHR